MDDPVRKYKVLWGIEEGQLPQFKELGRGGFLEEMICKLEMWELARRRKEGRSLWQSDHQYVNAFLLKYSDGHIVERLISCLYE